MSAVSVHVWLHTAVMQIVSLSYINKPMSASLDSVLGSTESLPEINLHSVGQL